MHSLALELIHIHRIHHSRIRKQEERQGTMLNGEPCVLQVLMSVSNRQSFQRLSRFDVACAKQRSYHDIGHELNRLLFHIIVHHSAQGGKRPWRRPPPSSIIFISAQVLERESVHGGEPPSCTNLTSSSTNRRTLQLLPPPRSAAMNPQVIQIQR